ncbi:hypothetical protein [Algoriphagus sp.]|uniref:hypothetical protein n=1 Tax=Algoriphagus sp. TaxID=1872435 RepID=UPI0025EC8D25|nr:hypothetical protein [Algoriphagus sp.]
MKKAKSILAFGLLVVLLNSCVYSLFPIYTDDTLVYFPELIGKWEMEDEPQDYVEFRILPEETGFFANNSDDDSKEPAKEKSYLVVIEDEGDITNFVGHVAKIGNDFFLDLFPYEKDYEETLASNVLPVHTFIKLKYVNDQLNLTAFDLEKLNKLFESNLIRLRHENVDGTILITAQPKEIQKFLDRYSDDESVFEGTDIYKRAS